jgi:hypothetical protein
VHKIEQLEKNLPQCHIANKKSHMTKEGISDYFHANGNCTDTHSENELMK